MELWAWEYCGYIKQNAPDRQAEHNESCFKGGLLPLYGGRVGRHGAIRYYSIVALPWIMLLLKLDDFRIGGDRGNMGFHLGPWRTFLSCAHPGSPGLGARSGDY